MIRKPSESGLDLIPIVPRNELAAAMANSASALTATGRATAAVSPCHSAWLDGGVVLCECPDCGHLVTVRLWLMVADCWNCGANFELAVLDPELDQVTLTRSDGSASTTAKIVRRDQEARSRQGQSPPGQSPPGQCQVDSSPTARREVRHGSTTDRVPQSRTLPTLPVAQRPPSRRPPRQFEPSPGLCHARDVLRRTAGDWLGALPAWLLSLILHLMLLLLLALWIRDASDEHPSITLAMVIGKHDIVGDSPARIEPENSFDRLAPTKEIPDAVNWADASIASDEALRLRLDPNAVYTQLPPVESVMTKIESDPDARGTVVTRDPRLRDRILYNEGGTSETETAVARGLHWLANQQESDGSWRLRQRRTNVAATSLALLPFLGAGQTHQYGQYQPVVAGGLSHLMDVQLPDGDLRGGSPYNIGMYAHGQAAIVLCEALTMTGDPRLRDSAQRSIDFIVEAQHPRGGGWRYEPRQPGDTSVLGWQLMALQSARAAGLSVPSETLERASHYLDRASHLGGAAYGYQPKHPPSPTMTAEGLLCRIYLGWPADHPGILAGGSFLAENPFSATPGSDPYYYWYYSSQTLHHLGGVKWHAWNLRLREHLVQTQRDSGPLSGSWPPRSPHRRLGTEIYSTALAVCTLEVYYRHAPIFRPIHPRR